jgi:pseudouridine synthase
MQIRLQKILSQAGVASRRAGEKLIAEGRVSVNGLTVHEMGTKADPAADEIRVDGRRVTGPEPLRYILLNKPPGYVTTRSDPQRRPTVIDLLGGVREYLYPVGRLDYDTEGLLLLTNDGDLAARLTHPRHGVDRTYEARVTGVPDERDLERLRTGIPLDGRRTLPADVELIPRRPFGPASASARRAAPDKSAGHHPREKRESVLRITIREGRTRQVRRMCDAIAHPVRALRRVRIGPLSDRRLKPGQWRELTRQEIRILQEAASGGSRRSGKVEK